MMNFMILFCLYIPVARTTYPIKYEFDSPPGEIVYDGDNRVRGFKDTEGKDFIIGSLFAVHRPLAGSAGGRCSADLIRSGAERTEAFLYSLDLINSDPDLLPNITLGYDLRDTCVSENIALDETIEFLFTESSADVCSNDNEASGFSYNKTTEMNSVAVIGPTTSQVSLSVASLLRLFTTPSVSYSVTSPTFNNRDRYGYFYRTHPSDSQEVQALVDLAVKFGWTHITTIHSNNAYGEPAIDVLRRLAEANGICIDLDIGLDDNLTPEQYLETAGKVLNESNASVIVFFASLDYVRQFMEQLSLIIKTNGNSRNFLWIGSTSWVQAVSITSEYADIIAGLMGLEVLTNTDSNFNDYFSRLTLNSNKRSQWFTEYYEDYFNCTKGLTCNSTRPTTDHPDYEQRNYIQLVIDAVYSVAHALNNFLLDNCDKPLKWNSVTQTCQGQTKQLNGLELRNYLQNVSFTSPSGNRILFDDEGNVDGRYKIINFQKNSADDYEFVNVGLWSAEFVDSERLMLYDNVTVQFGINQTDGKPLLSFHSQCRQCQEGHIKVSVQSSCCGTCAPCLGQEYSNSTTDTECIVCPAGMWGNDPLSGSHYCENIKETYLDPSDGFSIVLILVAAFGLISVLGVSVAMGIFWKTPIIKSSGREQMTLLLIGIALSFLVTVFFIVRPSVAICLLQRVCTWFCFSLILSALFVKLIRIARIFLRSHKSTRPRFVQSKYQVVFTFLLVSVQMILVVISLLVVYPEPAETVVLNKEDTRDSPTINIQCSAPHVAVLVVQILVYSALLLATNILAVMTLQFPENFNEARYVAFSTFSTLLIWVAFLQTYFAVDSSYRIAVICFAIQLTSLAVLFCLFVPRIFIIIVWPNKNQSKKPFDAGSSPVSTKLSSVPTNRKASGFQGLYEFGDYLSGKSVNKEQETAVL